jgi:DNA-binding transcriptional MerR regulator
MGVNSHTLRYYERRGLLTDPPRTSSRYRGYRPDAVRTVRFVKPAGQLGFSLGDIESPCTWPRVDSAIARMRRPHRTCFVLLCKPWVYPSPDPG